MTYSFKGKYMYLCEHLPTECACVSPYCIRIPCVSGVCGYATYCLTCYTC